MYNDQLNELIEALKDPIKGLFVKIPNTSPEVFQPVDGIGEILYTQNLVLHNLFINENSSKLDLDQSVRGLFLLRDDIWRLSIQENSNAASLQCGDLVTYSFTIQANEDSQVSLRRTFDDEVLHVAPLENFEGNDKSKLGLLHSAFHSKYQQEERMSGICLIPYKKKLKDALSGLCGERCLFNFQCKGDVNCSGCHWFKGFKCG